MKRLMPISFCFCSKSYILGFPFTDSRVCSDHISRVLVWGKVEVYSEWQTVKYSARIDVYPGKRAGFLGLSFISLSHWKEKTRAFLNIKCCVDRIPKLARLRSSWNLRTRAASTKKCKELTSPCLPQFRVGGFRAKRGTHSDDNPATLLFFMKELRLTFFCGEAFLFSARVEPEKVLWPFF